MQLSPFSLIQMTLLLLMMLGSSGAATIPLQWDAPSPDPAATPIAQYTLWRRNPTATSYAFLKQLDSATLSTSVTRSTATKGYACYQVRVSMWVPLTKAFLQQSEPAQVAGRPGCTALCLFLGSPARALESWECLP